MQAIVYQCDANGVFVGETTAQASPLEPGVYLMPAGAIEVAPPPISNNQRAVWMRDSNRWRLEKIPANPSQSVAQTQAELATQQRTERQGDARTALAESNEVVLHCYEKSVPVPVLWQEYRDALRALLSTDIGIDLHPLPIRPDIPAGLV